MASMNGKVKWFNSTKGFGFISPGNGDQDVFVHISAVQDSHLESLSENDEVTFDRVEGKSGKLQAENIKITN